MNTSDVNSVVESARESELMFSGSADRSLQQCVQHALQQYFAKLEGHSVANLYDMVLAEVEVPLLEAVMKYTRNNQSKAAVALGLSRGTLRKKLKLYDLE